MTSTKEAFSSCASTAAHEKQVFLSSEQQSCRPGSRLSPHGVTSFISARFHPADPRQRQQARIHLCRRKRRQQHGRPHQRRAAAPSPLELQHRGGRRVLQGGYGGPAGLLVVAATNGEKGANFVHALCALEAGVLGGSGVSERDVVLYEKASVWYVVGTGCDYPGRKSG